MFFQVKAPILFVAAEKDTLCPADSVRAAVALAPDAKLSIHDVTHFEIYLGDTLQVKMREYLIHMYVQYACTMISIK